MVRLMVETVALHLAMCLNRALCEQVDRAEQPQQRSGYNCAHEGSRPDIIREFASPSGRSVILGRLLCLGADTPPTTSGLWLALRAAQKTATNRSLRSPNWQHDGLLFAQA